MVVGRRYCIATGDTIKTSGEEGENFHALRAKNLERQHRPRPHAQDEIAELILNARQPGGAVGLEA